MIYLTTTDGSLRIAILETENLEEIKKGRPLRTPDGQILIAWTPDPGWLANEIMKSDGNAAEIGRLVDEGAKRPQAPLRPVHPPREHRLP